MTYIQVNTLSLSAPFKMHDNYNKQHKHMCEQNVAGKHGNTAETEKKKHVVRKRREIPVIISHDNYVKVQSIYTPQQHYFQ